MDAGDQPAGAGNDIPGRTSSMATRPRRREVECPMKRWVDEALVAALVESARRGDREERASNGLSGATVRSLARATGQPIEVVALALATEDVGALWGLPPVDAPADRELTGDLHAHGHEEKRSQST